MKILLLPTHQIPQLNLTLSNVYARIDTYNGDIYRVRMNIGIYATNPFESVEQIQPVNIDMVEVPTSIITSVDSIYDYLLTLPQYSDCTAINI